MQNLIQKFREIFKKPGKFVQKKENLFAHVSTYQCLRGCSGFFFLILFNLELEKDRKRPDFYTPKQTRFKTFLLITQDINKIK